MGGTSVVPETGGFVCAEALNPRLWVAKGSIETPFKTVRRDMLIN